MCVRSGVQAHTHARERASPRSEGWGGRESPDERLGQVSGAGRRTRLHGKRIAHGTMLSTGGSGVRACLGVGAGLTLFGDIYVRFDGGELLVIGSKEED